MAEFTCSIKYLYKVALLSIGLHLAHSIGQMEQRDKIGLLKTHSISLDPFGIGYRDRVTRSVLLEVFKIKGSLSTC